MNRYTLNDKPAVTGTQSDSATSSIPVVLFCVLGVLILGGCAAKPKVTLMPTPIMYQDAAIDPFKHLDKVHKNTTLRVYYATNRVPLAGEEGVIFGNGLDSTIHLGTAEVRLGYPDTTWEELRSLSTNTEPDAKLILPVNLEGVDIVATLEEKGGKVGRQLTVQQEKYFSLINQELELAVDKEIMVYVHGTKVDFENSVALTAEVDHFAGRDFVGIAFSWPSHQNIFHYLLRIDVNRAHSSSSTLREFLELLGQHTNARRINILAYSAGGKVASRALHELRQAYPHLQAGELKDKFRIGSVVLASVDVEVDHFLQRIDSISDISRQVVITVSDSDAALEAAHKYMGGRVRTGTIEAEVEELAYIREHYLKNVEIVDVSKGKEERGFDISGHHYWYRHPWMSSDIIMIMRTDLLPSRRGLSLGEHDSLWYLSREYPVKVRKAVERELDGQW